MSVHPFTGQYVGAKRIKLKQWLTFYLAEVEGGLLISALQGAAHSCKTNREFKKRLMG
jgi:hypothetical protein